MVRQSEGNRNYSYHQVMCAHHPLRYAQLYRSRSRAKVVETGSGEGEMSERVYEIAQI